MRAKRIRLLPMLLSAVLSMLVLLFTTLSYAQGYPTKPITVVVGFGIGGSVDRMARAMSSTLSDALGQPIRVINKKGAGTLLGAKYVLEKPSDGYTIFASAFSPYLSNTILEGNADYEIDDFAYLNFQWYEQELVALSKNSRFGSLIELLEEIRNKPKTVRAAVVRGSTGHLMAKLLLEVNNIDQQNLNLVTYNSGGLARAAVSGGVVDFLVISAKGSEGIREYIKPLAIVSDQPVPNWDVPTLNEALKPLGVTSPILPGSIRGFATTAKFKRDYPQRFNKLASAIKQALLDPELIALLDRRNIGRRWAGPAQADAQMVNTFEYFKNYSYLLKI